MTVSRNQQFAVSHQSSYIAFVPENRTTTWVSLPPTESYTPELINDGVKTLKNILSSNSTHSARRPPSNISGHTSYLVRPHSSAMSIELHVTDHIPEKTVYYPGSSTISGTLTLKGPIPDLPLSAYVRFLGFSRVNLNNEWPCYDIHFSDYRHHIFLLPSRCPLAQGEESVTNFSFKIPKNTMPGELQVDERTGKYWNSGWSWNTECLTGNHTLPPSYSDPGCGVSIRYMLSARCEIFDLVQGEAVRTVLDAKQSEGLCVRRRGVLEECAKTRRVPACFGKFDPHEAGFIIIAHLPSVVKIGELMPVSLELVYKDQTDKEQWSKRHDKLEVRVLSARHRVTRTALERHSDYQYAPKHVNGLPTDRVVRTSHKQHFECRDIAKDSGKVMEYGVQTCLSREINAVLSNELHIATFKSYKVSVWYSSKTTVMVECRGKKYKLEFNVDDLTALPSASDSVAVETMKKTTSDEITNAITSIQKQLVVEAANPQGHLLRIRSWAMDVTERLSSLVPR
jgi:hypothetical protein